MRESAVLCYVLTNYEKGKASSQFVVSSCHSFARFGYKRHLEIGNIHSNCYGKFCTYTFLRDGRKKVIETIMFFCSRNMIIIYSSFYVLNREAKWNVSILPVELKK
jgi:hypothetical protein